MSQLGILADNHVEPKPSCSCLKLGFKRNIYIPSECSCLSAKRSKNEKNTTTKIIIHTLALSSRSRYLPVTLPAFDISSSPCLHKNSRLPSRSFVPHHRRPPWLTPLNHNASSLRGSQNLCLAANLYRLGTNLVDKPKALSKDVKKGSKSSSWSKTDPYYVSWEARVCKSLNH